MPVVTLTLPSRLEEDLRAAALADVESAGVLVASIVRMDDEIRLLGRRLRWVPDDAYAMRGIDGLLIEDRGGSPHSQGPSMSARFRSSFTPIRGRRRPLRLPTGRLHGSSTASRRIAGKASRTGP